MRMENRGRFYRAAALDAPQFASAEGVEHLLFCKTADVCRLVFKTGDPEVKWDSMAGGLYYRAEDVVSPISVSRTELRYEIRDAGNFELLEPYITALEWLPWSDGFMCSVLTPMPAECWAALGLIPVWGGKYGAGKARISHPVVELTGTEPESCPGIDIPASGGTFVVGPRGGLLVHSFIVREPSSASAIFPDIERIPAGTHVYCGVLNRNDAYLRLADVPDVAMLTAWRDEGMTLCFYGGDIYIARIKGSAFPEGARVLFREKEYRFSHNPPANYWHRCEIAKPSLVSKGAWHKIYHARLGVLSGQYALKSDTPTNACRLEITEEQRVKRMKGFLGRNYSHRVESWERERLESAFATDGKAWFPTGDVKFGWPEDAAPKRIVDSVFRKAGMLRYCPIQMKDMVYPITLRDIVSIPCGGAAMLGCFSGEARAIINGLLADDLFRDSLALNILTS